MYQLSDFHCANDVIALFEGLFSNTYETRLIQGGEEPLYLPAGSGCAYHRIIFTQDFFASALHEVSHWCIAGAKRRELEDYGYWYLPDGRDRDQQKVFEQVEVAPQALELLFSQACGRRFEVSIDNLMGEGGGSEAFRRCVEARAQHYRTEGLPLRAHAFHTTLQAFYHRRRSLHEAIALGKSCLGRPSAG